MIVLFLMGMLISFLGQLPLGNMNMTATQLSVQEGVRRAWSFGIGIAIVEMIYLRLALTGIDWVIQNFLFFTILGWLTVVIFLALGVASFITAKKQSKEKKGLLLNNKMNRFVLGLMVSSLNPLQLPFWFIWTTYLLNNNLLRPQFNDYNVLTIGAGMGTLGGLAVYINGGNWAITKLKTSNKTLNIIMGIVFILTGLFQLYKMVFDPWVAPDIK